MPLSRYQIRNEYSLADPELYIAADKDDPEALLEGVAMAGLVGVLRQLGDLAEFAAEIFHELHEEVMVTAARGHGLMVRVQQLESEFPSIERAFLSQTSHSAFFSNAGIDWHPNLQTEQNLITRGDLPRFVMDSYEECRGPPRLFLLDKFDVAGAGSCLKRYTDPSFYKVEASSNEMTSAEVHRDKKVRKTKKKGSRWKNGETPETLPPSHVKLHQLFLEERVENGASEPARRVKLKRRPNKFPFDAKSGKSYMETLLKPPLEDKVVHEIPVASSPLKLPSNISSGSGLEIREIGIVGSGLGLMQRNRSPCPSPGLEKNGFGQSMDDFSQDLVEGGTSESLEAGNISSRLHEVVDEKDIAVDDDIKTDGSGDGYRSDDIASEKDNYMDALATMESETETDTEFRAKTDLGQLNVEKQETYSDANGEKLQSQFSDSQSIGNSTASDDGNGSIRKGMTCFSYSDTASTSADNMPLDGDDSPQVFPSTETRGTEIAWRSSDQLSITEKIPVTCHPEQEVPNDSCIEVSEIPSHSSGVGEASSGSCPTDSALPVDQGAILTEGTLVEPDLDEMSSRHSENFNCSMKTEERQIDVDNTLPFTSKTSDVPSPKRDDNPPSLLYERNSEDETDCEDPNVSSSPVIHFPNILEATPEKEDSENSFGKVIQTEFAEDGCDRDSVHSQLSSPHSVISHAEEEEQPFVPSLPEFEICVPDVRPDDFGSFSDDILPTAEIAVNSTLAADSPDTHDPLEEQLTEIADDVLTRKSDAAEVGVSYSTEKDLDGTFDEESGVQMGGEITPHIDLVASDFPLEFSKSPDPDQKLKVDERETETVQSEVKVVVAAVSVPIDGDRNEDNCHCSLERPDQNGLVIDESYAVQNNMESDTHKEVDQESVISSAVNSVPCDAMSYDNSNIELLDSAGSSLANEDDGNANDVNFTSANISNLQDQSLSNLDEADQNGEIINEACVEPNHKEFGTRKDVDRQTILSPDLDSIPCNTVSSNHSNVELLDSTPDSSLSIEAKKSLHLDIATTVSSSSNCLDQDLESMSPYQGDHIEEAEDVLSLASHFFTGLRSPLVETVEPQTNQLDMQSLHASGDCSQLERLDSLNDMDPIQPSEHVDELQAEQLDVGSINAIGATGESFQPQETQSSSVDHESHYNVSSETCSVPLSAEASVLEPPQSSSDKIDLSDQAKYPLTSVFSGFSLLPELPQLNLEEMPPLPPLPPVQWRMGKLQHASLTSSLPPILPSKSDEKPQMGYSAMDGDRVQPSNPFLAPSGITDENSHVCEDLTGHVANSSPLLLQLSNHENNQNGTASTYSSETLHEKVFLPPHQLSTEASLEREEHDHHSSTISEEKVVKPLEDVTPQQANKNEQSLSTSDGEFFWSSSTSSLPSIDDGRPNEIRAPKLMRPRSPLIDAVAAHDKSKLRKVGERVRPQLQKVEERDSLLEQIRAKSFNLKPAVPTRPSIQGPKTNLKVAAILEKANAIRQALAGSDEDDDSGSWSDS